MIPSINPCAPLVIRRNIPRGIIYQPVHSTDICSLSIRLDDDSSWEIDIYLLQQHITLCENDLHVGIEGTVAGDILVPLDIDTPAYTTYGQLDIHTMNATGMLLFYDGKLFYY